MAPGSKRRIAAEDLYRIELITDARVSPDGEHVVYALQRVDRKTEKKFQNLWIVPTRGGRPRPFTVGDQVDATPRWSPDGRWVAFLSNRRDEKQMQLYRIPFDGGEARPLTDEKGTFGAFAWSPDGRRLAVQFRRHDPEAIEREKDEQKRKLGVVARHVTRVFFKLDGVGYLPKERWHIASVAVPNGRMTTLTQGAVHDETGPAWSPDGAWIAFASNRAADPDLDPDAVDLFVMPSSGGRARPVASPLGSKELLSYSPDGRQLAYVGQEGRGQWWRNAGVWVVPVEGKGPARNLTAAHDLHVAAWTINDLGQPEAMPPTWTRDGARLLFQVTRHGNTELLSVGRDGTDLRTEIGGTGVVGAFTLDREHSRLVHIFGGPTDPCQVRVRDLAGGPTRTLTDVNGPLLRRCQLSPPEEVWFEGRDGYRLQGWVLKPPGARRGRRHPAIVEIHGGPLVQYGNVLMHEFHLLAARGYVVAFSNPRGGRGYGEAHAKAAFGAWGTVDYEDVMAWADHVAGLPYVDAERMGVTGGSYGGFMTNWIIGHTNRFKAAVTQRSVSNMISLWGSSDFNWVFEHEVGGKPPYEDVQAYWDRSPLKHLGNARTPTLVLHNEQDLRCAIEQGEQVFVALKRLGVPTEMVRFPDEPHGLSRTGRTDRRIARLNHILRWFDQHLAP